MPRLILTLISFSALAFVQSSAFAQTSPNLETFLAAVRNAPSLQANAALLEAAEARLAAVYSPVAFTGSAGFGFLNYSGLDGLEPSDVGAPSSTTNIGLGLSFRPFLYGDLADLASQQAAEVARARLSYAETLSSLEAQALEAAASLRLSSGALALAQQGESLANEVLAATQTRFERGGATAAELRDANQQLAEASANVLNSEANLVVARQSLALLVGLDLAQGLDDLPELPTVGGISPSVARARLDLSLAELGLSSIDRGFIPTAQVSYALPFEDEKSQLTFSLESATFQPNVSFNYQDPRDLESFGQAGEGAGSQLNTQQMDSPPPDFRLDGTFSIGLSADLSVVDFRNREAAAAQIEAAQAGLQAALEREQLTALSLGTAIEANEVRLELAETVVTNAEMTLAEVSARRDAGLATNLDVDQSTFAVTQAQLDVLSAERDLLVSVLDTYRSYAVLPSSLLLDNNPDNNSLDNAFPGDPLDNPSATPEDSQ